MKKFVCALAALALAVPLASCGQSAADKKAAESSSAPEKIQVKSCDETLTLDKAPERVLMISDVNSSILDELGVLDKVVFRAGDDRIKNVRPELKKKLDKIESAESGKLGTGGSTVATETVLDMNVDLVIGYDKAVDRKALAEAGVPLYSPDSYCPNYKLDHADFGLVDNEIEKMGKIFQVEKKAEEVKKNSEAQIQKIKPSSEVKGAKAVAVFVTPGSDKLSAFNSSSMVQPIFEANGIENAYADGPKRVFPISMEDLLAKNPDYIVVLSLNPDENEALSTFASFPGSEDLKASQEGQVVFLPFALTDPPSTLSVDGAVELANRLQK